MIQDSTSAVSTRVAALASGDLAGDRAHPMISETPHGACASTNGPSFDNQCRSRPLPLSAHTLRSLNDKAKTPSRGTGSLPSSAGSSAMTGECSVDIEKRECVSSQETRGWSTDPEKGVDRVRHSSQQPTKAADVTRLAYFVEEDEEDVESRVQAQKAVNALVFLSGPCVFVSIVNFIWACLVLFITLLSQPVRLCARRVTFSQQLITLLGPTLNIQLGCIYAPLPLHSDGTTYYDVTMLVLVHLLSPILSFGIMLAAWLLAIYWASSAVVGDPSGMDKRDDGRETVLGLRRWWEHWLMRAVKDE